MPSDALDTLLPWLAAMPASPPAVIGICGAQGSGKTTLCRRLAEQLAACGRRVAVLALDDFYLTRAERTVLASRVHALLLTRGVPGTHDVALAETVIDALRMGRPARIPRFDKSRDDRATEAEATAIDAGIDVILFEGWCVGAAPQRDEALAAPVNQLEREQDRDGAWRRHVNAQLTGAYRRLWERLDRLVLLAAPSFDVVAGWRAEQEATLGLERRAAGLPNDGLMDRGAIGRFVAHYERLTRHILAEMPGRADLTIQLDDQRRPRAIIRGEQAHPASPG